MTRDSIDTRRRAAVQAAAGTVAALAAPAIVKAQNRWKPERPIVIYNPFAGLDVSGSTRVRYGGVTIAHPF